MNATTDRIIETTPRPTLRARPYDKWQFVVTSRGFEARLWLDVNAMTPEERAEYEKEEKEMEAMDAAFPGVGGGPPDPVWPTLELAKEYAAFEDRYESIDQDLHAFGAPSECYEDAFAGYDAQREALMAMAVKP